MNIFSPSITAGNRNHGLFWGSSQKEIFNTAGYGIKYDSSLGSRYSSGYIFGTGLPFFLRNERDYKSSNVLEFPLHIMDAALPVEFGGENGFEKSLSYIAGFIRKSKELYFSIITADFHYVFLTHKSRKINNLKTYLDFLKNIKDAGLLAESMDYFNNFWRQRLLIKLTSQWHCKNNLLTVTLSHYCSHFKYGFLIPKSHKNNTISECCAYPSITIDNRDYLIVESSPGKEFRFTYENTEK